MILWVMTWQHNCLIFKNLLQGYFVAALTNTDLFNLAEMLLTYFRVTSMLKLMMKSEKNYFYNSDNEFKFISSSNFLKLVYIFQTGSYFSNWFIFFKLVHIFQTGLYFSNWFIFFKLVYIFQTGLYFSNWFIFFKLVHIFQTGSYFSNWFIFFQTSLIFSCEQNMSMCVKHTD